MREPPFQKQAQQQQQTRARLVQASAELFAERGFRKVTVREICQRAHANVAAINYHFGDKLGLYREVLQTAIDVLRGTTDAARVAGAGKPPAEQLGAFVSVFLDRMLTWGTDSWLHRLMMREMADPTPALDAIVEQGLRPRIDYVSTIVAALLECPVSDDRVMRCVGSVHAQCIMARRSPVADKLVFNRPVTPRDIEDLAIHITQFSLAGIAALKSASNGRSVGPARRAGGVRPRPAASRSAKPRVAKSQV